MHIAQRPMTVPIIAAGAALVGAGVWVLRRFDPNVADSGFVSCLFHDLTGWYCPGCGTTRALHALVHGDLAGFVAMNPLLPVLGVLLPALLLQGLGRPLPLPRVIQQVLLSAKFWIALIVGYWVLRNLPWWPFSWLAPG